jgi:hypothetical protein
MVEKGFLVGLNEAKTQFARNCTKTQILVERLSPGAATDFNRVAPHLHNALSHLIRRKLAVRHGFEP